MHLHPSFLSVFSAFTATIFLSILVDIGSARTPGSGVPLNLWPEHQQQWPADTPVPDKFPAELGRPYIEPFPELDEIGQANCHVYGPKAPLADCLIAMTEMPTLQPDVAVRCPVDHTETRFWQHGWCRIALIDTSGLAECIHPFDMHLAVVAMLQNCTEIPSSKDKYQKEGPLVSGYMALPLPSDFIAIAGDDWYKRYKREMYITRVPVLHNYAIGQQWRQGEEVPYHWDNPGAHKFGGKIGGAAEVPKGDWGFVYPEGHEKEEEKTKPWRAINDKRMTKAEVATQLLGAVEKLNVPI